MHPCFDQPESDDYLRDGETDPDADADLPDEPDGEEPNPEEGTLVDIDGEPIGPDDLSDDGDALASIGWGTDEDYGYDGGDEW